MRTDAPGFDSVVAWLQAATVAAYPAWRESVRFLHVPSRRGRDDRRRVSAQSVAQLVGPPLFEVGLRALEDDNGAIRFRVGPRLVAWVTVRESLLAPMLDALRVGGRIVGPYERAISRLSFELDRRDYALDLRDSLASRLMVQAAEAGEDPVDVVASPHAYGRRSTSGEPVAEHLDDFLATVPADVLRSEVVREYRRAAKASGLRRPLTRSHVLARLRELGAFRERRLADGWHVTRPPAAPVPPLSDETRAAILGVLSRRGRPRQLPGDWQTIRAAVLVRDGHRCTQLDDAGRRCRESTPELLQVDHLNGPHDHRPESLATVCERHHYARTAARRRGDDA
jgi:hypothetical protein